MSISPDRNPSRNASQLHRRAFLAAGAAAMSAGCVTNAPQAFFKQRKLPIGIQLYTLGPDASENFEATLKAVAGIGYTTVELPNAMGRTPVQIRAVLDSSGLTCPSVHVAGRGPDSFSSDLGKLADGLRTIGARTAVMPIPNLPDHVEQRPTDSAALVGWFKRVLAQMTPDDWKMNADFLNEKAAVLAKSGIRVAYHNHNFGFAPLAGATGFDILMRRTDPALVTFELDAGWAVAAGVSPADLLAKYKGRFRLMHVKDLKADTKTNFALSMDPTEVGSGMIDWRALLPEAYAAGIRDFFVEQEPPFARPRIEAARISYDYLAGVRA